MNGKNLYVLIYNYLLTRIHYGFYPEGEALPTIQNLSNLFGVSTMAVRGALGLLRQNGYIVSDDNGRSMVCVDPKNQARSFPPTVLIHGKALEDVHQSFDLIFPSIYFYGLSVCSERELDALRQILKKPLSAWDEPIILFLAHIVKQLKNPLLTDLYYDVMLFCYPTYFAYVAADQEQWKNICCSLSEKLENILLLTNSGDAALWNVIKQTYPHFEPQSCSDHRLEQDCLYHWGKPQICQTAASEIVARIYNGTYPMDTFLPSARVLAEEFSMAIITLRRSIILLNDLGVVESVNGKGTKVIPPEQGLKKVKWDDPTISKNIMLYLESLHILTITCRLLANSFFPLIGQDERTCIKEKIKLIHHKNQVGLANTICLKALVAVSNLPSLNVVYNKLFNFMILGQPLSYLKPSLLLDRYTEALVASLDSGDADQFGYALEQAYAVTFISSKQKAISMGIKEAENLFLPFLTPAVQSI